MKVFVVHRFKDKQNARRTLKRIGREWSLDLQLVFLDSTGRELWEKEALDEIGQAEVVVVFNREACEESTNANWEIERAEEMGKEIVDISSDSNNSEAAARLRAIYDLAEEFEGCFAKDGKDSFELYKLMIESSESLIQRRQRTNAFFITVIGSLLAIAGLLVKTGALNSQSFGILYGFSVVGLLLCNSWRNLIDNYGKLNKAKFDVILRLEKELGSRIYGAEWVALGKGVRPKKYRSFTSTEKNVPLYFALLIVALTLVGAVWQVSG